MGDREFDQQVSSAVWGDSWPGITKSLVVVYQYSELPMVAISVDGDRMHFIASPSLRILGAAYGRKDVTEKMKGMVKNRALKAPATDGTFGDSWVGVYKTLVTVYQYGEEQPSLAVVKEPNALEFAYSPKNDFYGSTNPNTLTILGATYGPANVTVKVQSLVKEDNTLEIIKPTDALFGDPWVGIPKTLAVVYRYGRNPPQVQIAQEGTTNISISTPEPQTYASLLPNYNLLEDGDSFALAALNGMFVSCCSSDFKLGAFEATVDKGSKLVVRKDHSNSQFFKL